MDDTLLADFIQNYGYWALTLGCLLEGEALLLLAGFAAHEGQLRFLYVVMVAAVAGFVGDQFFFWLGRRHGPAVLERWPSVASHTEQLHRLIARWQAGVVVGVRFAYGLRIAGPILIGMSPIEGWRFAMLNALGALLWAVLVGGAGWVFGEAAQAALGKLHHMQGRLLLALLGLAAAVWLVRRLMKR